jgi:hypothetical protein
MQSSVVKARDEEEETGPIGNISNQIVSLAKGTRLEIENFKLSTQKAQNGITVEFAFRATVRFPEKERTL